jgi:hypothetical protein
MRTKLIPFTILLALVVILSACSPSTAVSSSDRVLSVSGTGTVYLTPDIAYLYVGVHVEDADISAAVERNNQRSQSVIDALVGLGVAAEDIQTSNFSIWSSEAYDDIGMRYTNYMVDNTVYITIRDISQLGTLLNAAVEAGANTINSISFDVEDKSAALVEARQLAMENARSLAEELAAIAGVTAGEIQTITYNEYYPSPYYGMGGGGASLEAAAVPIQPGKMEITVTVSASYAIR